MKYTIKDIKKAECNLEPLHCVHCDSKEVTYNQHIGDAYCSDCGSWQEDTEEREDLKVTSIRYFETRRGFGYECKTNREGITIWNDGQGGTTYIDILSHLSSTEAERFWFRELGDDGLEKLIDEYEFKKL